MTSFADALVGLGLRLRAAGLPADPEAIRALLVAATQLDPLDPQQIRAASRALTCTHQEHLPVHDAVFDAAFGLNATRPRSVPDIEAVIPRPEPSAEGPGGQDATVIPEASWSENLRHADLGLEDGDEAARLIDGLVFRAPRGVAHRTRPGHTGSIDTRRIIRDLIGSEEISRIPRRRDRHRRRAVTLVADVSASMTPWRESVLRFLDRGSAALGARCFTAGTRLTRVDCDRASSGARKGAGSVAAALRDVVDAGGGTRLGDSLLDLLTGRTKDLVRGSVLVVISDGWEHGDCTELARACARLERLTHRVLWVNPRAGRSGFAPHTRGLAVAAQHAETVLPATTVAQWQTAATTITERAWARASAVSAQPAAVSTGSAGASTRTASAAREEVRG